MGLCSTKQNSYDRICTAHPSVLDFEENFDLFGLTSSDVSDIHGHFSKIADAGGCVISIEKICLYFDADHKRFVSRIYSFLQHGSKINDSINLGEFIACSWIFCSNDPAKLYHYTFDLCSTAYRSSLTKHQFLEIVKDIFGSSFKSDPVSIKILSLLSQYHEFKLTSEDEFVDFCKSHPLMLYPVACIQGVMRSLMLGTRRWKSLQKYRLEEKRLTREYLFSLKQHAESFKRRDAAKALQMERASLVIATPVSDALLKGRDSFARQRSLSKMKRTSLLRSNSKQTVPIEGVQTEEEAVTGAVTLTNRPALPPFRKMSTFESKPSHDDLNLYADLDTSHPGTSPSQRRGRASSVHTTLKLQPPDEVEEEGSRVATSPEPTLPSQVTNASARSLHYKTGSSTSVGQPDRKRSAMGLMPSLESRGGPTGHAPAALPSGVPVPALSPSQKQGSRKGTELPPLSASSGTTTNGTAAVANGPKAKKLQRAATGLPVALIEEARLRQEKEGEGGVEAPVVHRQRRSSATTVVATNKSATNAKPLQRVIH